MWTFGGGAVTTATASISAELLKRCSLLPGLSAKNFVSAILRVYCVPLRMVDLEIPNSFAEYEALEKDFVPRLEKLLAKYSVMQPSDDNVDEITRISTLMIQLLRLDRPYRSNRHNKYGPFTQLTYAGIFSASTYYKDSIGLVECPSREKSLCASGIPLYWREGDAEFLGVQDPGIGI